LQLVCNLSTATKNQQLQRARFSSSVRSQHVKDWLERVWQDAVRLQGEDRWMDWVETAQKRILQEAIAVEREKRVAKFRAENKALTEIKLAEE